VVKKKQSKVFKIHEFYLKENVSRTYFYPNGKKWLVVERITKKGTYGRYCFEIKFVQKEYYESGILKSKEITSCDCFKEKKFHYDKDGKLISAEKTNNRWIKHKMD
jgi:antitoxin component YwqK of YwqJK toxin-antitoxin module